MAVYLVQPPIGGQKIDITPPLSLLLLAAILEKEGHEVQIVDLNLDFKLGRIDPQKSLRTQFVRSLPKRSSQIELVGITTWSYNFAATIEYVEAIKKKHPRVPIVLGGPHVTFVDREVLETFPQVDYVLRDEGDRTFPQLLRALRHEQPEEKLALIPGLTWRKGDEVVRNASGGVFEDLDQLPYPAYHLIDVQEYLSCAPVLLVEAGRGCPYNCNFCSTTNMFQRKYRVKSAPRLVDEIEWLMEHTGGRRFELLHDNLVAKKDYVKELSWEIRQRNLDFDWSCTSRTDNMSAPVAEDLFLAGCVSVFFGVESLSAERQKWTGKRLVPEKVHEAIEVTASRHLVPSLGIIVGFPDESQEELDVTLSTAFRWTVDPQLRAEVSTAALRYYPGADLFAHAAELRFDELASAAMNVIPGYELRPEWREKTSLFPLHAIHTPPDETRTNLLRREFVRCLIKAAPLTFVALVDRRGLSPRDILDRMAAGREFSFLRRPTQVTVWNESLLALAAVVEEEDDDTVRAVFTLEVPFWRTEPAIEAIQGLDHVIAPMGFEQQALLDYARGARAELPPRVEGQSVLGIRCGLECVVWVTDRPQPMWEAFQRQFELDPRGTVDFVNSLRRGVM